MKTSPTYTEQFRKECEARHVLTMSRQRRKAYYQGVKEKCGAAAEKELIAEVRRQYKMREKAQGLELA